MENDNPPRDDVTVRNLHPDDLDALVALDAKVVGRRREEFLKLKLRQAFADSGIAVSLAAELCTASEVQDVGARGSGAGAPAQERRPNSLRASRIEGRVVGFLLARVYYGEFGVTERVAVLDVLGVHPDFRGRHVGAALIDQLRTNLLGLGLRTLQTEVAWQDGDLMAFFRHEGFVPAQRLCLDLDLARTRR
jgi:ribosomal protein S18 acetylase RimI-like enzyme